jgi:hypothetical protein
MNKASLIGLVFTIFLVSCTENIKREECDLLISEIESYAQHEEELIVKQNELTEEVEEALSSELNLDQPNDELLAEKFSYKGNQLEAYLSEYDEMTEVFESMTLTDQELVKFRDAFLSSIRDRKNQEALIVQKSISISEIFSDQPDYYSQEEVDTLNRMLEEESEETGKLNILSLASRDIGNEVRSYCGVPVEFN